jgi:G3E family GTPase
VAQPEVRLHLLFGFLGSGKTTLARRLLGQRAGDGKMAVIVNDFGDVGIDGAILEGRNVDMIELTSGCLCCTLKGSLLNAIEELSNKAGARRIVIEATGVASPEEMLETLSDRSVRGRYDIGPIVTVVDAARFDRLSDMLGEFYTAQLEYADLVILNKIDLASAATLEHARHEIASLNSGAALVFADRCDVDVADVLDGPSSAVVARSAAAHAGHDDHVHDHGADHEHGHEHDGHRHAPADSFAVSAEGDFDLDAFRGFMQSLGEDVWRAKGFIRAQDRTWLVQYTMSGLELSEAEGRTHYNLVFIGRGMDRRRIEDGLQRTLLAAAGKS